MENSGSRTWLQKNIFLFKGVLLFKVTAYLLRQYLLLPFGRSTSFRFFVGIYHRQMGTKMIRISPFIPYIDLEDLCPGIGSALINTIGKFNTFRTFKVTSETGCLVTPYELQILCALVKKTCPEKILEIGTHRGWTISNLALNAPSNCQIMTMDIAPLIPNNTEIQEIFTKYSIKFFHADSTQFDFSPFHSQIDFIFIDASHSEEDVERDTASALKILSSKGIIVWHDHNLEFPGVINCLHRLSTQIMIFHIPGTALAVHYRGSGCE